MKPGGEVSAKVLRKKSVSVPMIAVTGGKGGTGKTTVAVNLAVGLSLKGSKVMLVDADVDCPCCAMLLGTELNASEEVRVFKPVIDAAKCTGCGRCVEVCREHALVGLEGQVPSLFEELCSGCKACQLVCEAGAMKSGQKVLGTIYVADSNGIKLVVGELKPTEPRSPIVARATMLKAAEELKLDKHDIVIVDTAPGIHNVVAQALWEADLALAVTEPTPLGAHDLGFMLDLTEELGLPTEVILNKADIPSGLKDKVVKTSRDRGVKIVAEIPMDEELLRSYVSGEPLVRKSPKSPAAAAMLTLVPHIREMFVKGGET
ncbi:MAG: P-loop NTPase [Candidatus Hodarchaeaceae archaeon]|nr:P-loop NTPase [Candidatus Hodarchaeaceae archaeon]